MPRIPLFTCVFRHTQHANLFTCPVVASRQRDLECSGNFRLLYSDCQYPQPEQLTPVHTHCTHQYSVGLRGQSLQGNVQLMERIGCQQEWRGGDHLDGIQLQKLEL